MAYRPTSWVQNLVILGGFGVRFGAELVKEGMKNLAGTIWDHIRNYLMASLIWIVTIPGVGLALYISIKILWLLFISWIGNKCCGRSEEALNGDLLTQVVEELHKSCGHELGDHAGGDKQYAKRVGGKRRICGGSRGNIRLSKRVLSRRDGLTSAY